MPNRRHLTARIRCAATIVVVVVYAVVAAFGGALVVCAEDDGHVAFEWRGSGCCAPDRPVPSPAAPSPTASLNAPSSGASDCVACDDTPASELLASRECGTKRTSDDVLPHGLHDAAAATAASPAWAIPTRIEMSGPRLAPNPPPPSGHLRTTVLRC